MPGSAAPPVSADGFSFAHGEFFVEASGHNQHRRATPAELQEHFRVGSAKDHPAHWFEAQLIHYGLQPSKTKSVARMRLFDAVSAGRLAVPAHMAALEGQLRKQWTKQAREANKALRGASPETTTKKTAGVERKAGAKRKAEVNVSVTINTTVSTDCDSPEQPAAKKARSAAPAKTPAAKAASNTKTAAKKQTARRGAVSQGPCRNPSIACRSPSPPRAKQKARRGGISQGPSRSPSATFSPPSPRPRLKQTARRSGAAVARGRIPAPPAEVDHCDTHGSFDDDDDDDGDDDEAPPPYSTHPQGFHDYHHGSSLAPLGLLNGRYDISCPYVTSEWPSYGSDFDLVLTLAGSTLWGGFDLGVIQGVLYFPERPWQSSHDCVPFEWRGREDQGPIIYGDNNRGWIRFLGDGRIQGQFDYQQITFQGRRLPGQGTRSEADAHSLQMEWDEYSEDEYERECRDRWR